MIRGSRVSVNALVPRMRAQEIISDNIADPENDGFGRERITFHTHYAHAIDGAGGAGRNWPHQRVVTQPDDHRGAIHPTGGTLDFAIDGAGFLAVRTPQGECYTRSGSFRVGPEGNLLTSAVHKAMGEGEEITLLPGHGITGADGSIRVGDAVVDTLRLVSIDPKHLIRDGHNALGTGPPGTVGA